MAFFETGTVYRDQFEIKHTVAFFNGELAVGERNGEKYYLQAAYLHKMPPARAVQQYLNLKSSVVLPYQEILIEEDLLVFVRPFLAIRPLRDVIKMDISEEQAISWMKQLLQLEAMLRSKAIPMYLLLDTRNIGVTKNGELQVIFCGLEKIMVTETKLDWGTFLYSLLSGQFLEGPILKIPKDFSVSRPMMKLIQKTLRVYAVEQVMEQLELYERRKSGSVDGIFERLIPSAARKSQQTKPPSSFTPVPDQQKSSSSSNAKSSLDKTNPTFSVDQLAQLMQKREEQAASKESDQKRPVKSSGKSILEQLAKMNQAQQAKSQKTPDEEKDELLEQIDEILTETSPEKREAEESTSEDEGELNDAISSVQKRIASRKNIRFLRGVKLAEYTQRKKEMLEGLEELPIEEGVTDVVETKSSKQQLDVPNPSKPDVLETPPEQESWSDYYEALELDDASSLVDEEEHLETKNEESATVSEDQTVEKQAEQDKLDELKSNTRTYKVNPALALLEDEELTDSFIITLDQHRQEYKEQQQKRIQEMRKKFEEQQRKLLEQKRKELEQEQQKLLEEQRKKLEKEEAEILRREKEALEKERKEREERERKERERKKKEKFRRARLEYERQLWEQKELELMEKEQKALEAQQQEILQQLLKDFERKKQELLEKQRRDFEERRRKKIAQLREQILGSEAENEEVEEDEEISPLPPKSYDAIEEVRKEELEDKEREFLTMMGYNLEDQHETSESVVEQQSLQTLEVSSDNSSKQDASQDSQVEPLSLEADLSPFVSVEKEIENKEEQREDKPKVEERIVEDIESKELLKKEEKSKEVTSSEEDKAKPKKKKNKSYNPFSKSTTTNKQITRSEKQRAARLALQQSFENHEKKKEEKRKRKQEKKMRKKLEAQQQQLESQIESNPKTKSAEDESSKQIEKQEVQSPKVEKFTPKVEPKQQEPEPKKNEEPAAELEDTSFDDELFQEIEMLLNELDDELEGEKEQNQEEQKKEEKPTTLEDRLEELEQLLEEEERKAKLEEQEKPSTPPKEEQAPPATEKKKEQNTNNLAQQLQDYMKFFHKK